MTFMYLNWNLCTLIGIGAGRFLQGIGGWGLDFAMVAAFIGMVIPYLKDKPNVVVVVVSGTCALAFHGLPHQLGLIIASLLGLCAGALSESLTAGRLRRAAKTVGEK
jgi:predicted branched-subunit amino acid permease